MVSSILPSVDQPHAIVVQKDPASGQMMAHIFVGRLVRGSLRDLEFLQSEIKKPLVFIGSHGLAGENGMSVEQETIRDAAAIVPSQEIIQVPVAALIEAIGHKVVSITGFEPGTSDDRFREKVERVQADMISKGRVCQLIVSRLFESKLLEGGPHDVFTRLLAIPGSEMVSFFSLGDEAGADESRYIMHASPETHFNTFFHQKEGYPLAQMRPIAGTINIAKWIKMSRKKFARNRDAFEAEVLKFLKNPKEISELMMVLDEHLKIMCDMCYTGSIRGPNIRVAGAALHTEFEIIGTLYDMQNVLGKLCQTLHASTLIGGPQMEAFKCIGEIEDAPREWYGGVTGVYNPNNALSILRTAINIRGFYITADGRIYARAGAGIVGGGGDEFSSDPQAEADETRTKISGLVRSLETRGIKVRINLGAEVNKSQQIKRQLLRRRESLNRFFRERLQNKITTPEILQGKEVTILQCEDKFTSLLEMMLEHAGARVRVVKWQDFDYDEEREKGMDALILGPGPGDINDINGQDAQKMERIRQIGKEALEGDVPIFAECLGHQLVGHTIGGEGTVVQQSRPSQGAHDGEVRMLEREYGLILGAYNSFRVDPNNPAIQDRFDFTTEVIGDGEESVVHMRTKEGASGPRIATTQKHLDSVMSPHGAEEFLTEMAWILGESSPVPHIVDNAIQRSGGQRVVLSPVS